MDLCKSEKALEKQSTGVPTRRPVVPAENKNGTTRRSRTREVSSRYQSPTPSAASAPKRCSSPNASRTSSTSTVSVQKRAISAERKRPSTPLRPRSPSPSTPVQDTTAEMLLAARKTVSNKLPESLWPSTMRSLSVSFQSDTFSVPIGKKERTVSHTSSDRTLRPSSNVAHRGETPSPRKPTPERNRSPLKGKNSGDQLENSKPADSLPGRLLHRHQWPSRTSGKISTSPNRSELFDQMNKTASLFHSKTGTPSLRRLSLDGTSKPLHKPATDLLMLISRDESGKEMLYGSSVDDGKLRPGSSTSSDGTSLMNAAARARSLRTPGSRPPSPSVSRGVSPSRQPAKLRPSSPSSRGTSPARLRPSSPSSRGNSPARLRPSSPSRQPQNLISVLRFMADIKEGMKAANHIEDVHQLRLLYNRHLQWRYANARTDAALRSQKVKAERVLHSVWRIIVDLLDSVSEKRSDLQQLRLKMNLYSVLDNQLTLLDEWASIERNHANSLTSAIQGLQASTVRIPLTGGARGDIKTIKAAVCSTVDVMQAMGSSLCSILPQVEEMNCLLSELADVAAQERAMLDEWESLLGCTAALQVEEYSLRSHLLQMKQAWRNDEHSIFDYYDNSTDPNMMMLKALPLPPSR